MTTFYFTATGNCLYVAREIGGTLVSIPQALKNKDFECDDEVIGVVYPCYGFGMPNIVREFLSHVSWNADYCFAVMTYGNVAAAGLRVIEKFAGERGIEFDYMNSLLMVDNYLPNFEIEDQIKNLPGKQVDKHLAQIVSDIAERKQYKPTPSAMERIFSPATNTAFNLFRQGNFGQKNYLIDEKCNQCGICARVCPTNNIAVDEDVRFGTDCESCLACIHMCPQNAIHLKSEKSAVRYRNEHVTVKDIITANNQGV